MKSVNDDGTNVTTFFSTNIVGTDYFAIRVSGSYIYYANYNQLSMIFKTQGSTPTVLYNDTNRIGSIFVFNSSGMYFTFFKLI